MNPAEGPFNVLEPGKHPRVTLTPTLALKDGQPYLIFSVQGGDSQDQNLLQFFLNVVGDGFLIAQTLQYGGMRILHEPQEFCFEGPHVG